MRRGVEAAAAECGQPDDKEHDLVVMNLAGKTSASCSTTSVRVHLFYDITICYQRLFISIL